MTLRMIAFLRILCLVFLAAFVTPNIGLAQTNEQIGKDFALALDLIERQIKKPNVDDVFLSSARRKLEDLKPEIASALAPILEQQKQNNTLISELGAAPSAETTESEEVRKKRLDLEATKAEFAIQVDGFDKLSKRADELLDLISQTRSAVFRKAIFERQPVHEKLFLDAVHSARQETIALFLLLRNWFTFVAERSYISMLVLFLGILSAVTLIILTPRYFGRLILRSDQEHAPSYLSRLSTALGSTIFVVSYNAMLLGSLYYLATWFGLLRGQISELFIATSIAWIGGLFVYKLAREFFSPNFAQWRLINLSTRSATSLNRLVVIVGAIYFVDFLLDDINRILSAPLALTVAKTLVAALLLGSAILAIAYVRKDSLPQDDGGVHTYRWINLPVYFIGIVIIGAALTGYVGLARFLSKQIVVSGALLCLIYLGVQTARELGKPESLSSTRLGRWLLEDKQLSKNRVDQFGLSLGSLTFVATLVIGIPLLLLQWGSQWEDIWFWTKQLLSGVQIGTITISFADIFVGLALFAIGFLITRLVQNWLGKTVLPRTRIDPGVKHSVNAGVGYVGIAIAAIIGITSAGLDLSNFALVAGALSLGIGFGLQNIVNNFVSGIILLIERPIKVGDWIEAGGIDGFVRKISVRATEIETFQKKSVMLPNSELINSQVGNWTHEYRGGRVDIPIGVAYGSDVKLVERILLEIAKENDLVLKFPEPFVFFSGFGDSSLDFELRVFLNDITTQIAVQNHTRFAIVERFRDHDIEIPFPQRDLNVRTVDSTVMDRLRRTGQTLKPAKKVAAS